MFVTGEKEGPPTPVGTSIGDVGSGVHATAAIGFALYHRERTGRGQHVDIANARVVDEATAKQVVASRVPVGAVPIGTAYAELDTRGGKPIVVHGTVVKATNAVGYTWAHLQDGTGDAAQGTNDLTVKTEARVAVGQRVAFRGTLQGDVDVGFGYHFDALVEDAVLVE